MGAQPEVGGGATSTRPIGHRAQAALHCDDDGRVQEKVDDKVPESLQPQNRRADKVGRDRDSLERIADALERIATQMETTHSEGRGIFAEKRV